jgi:hypothetical protein
VIIILFKYLQITIPLEKKTESIEEWWKPWTSECEEQKWMVFFHLPDSLMAKYSWKNSRKILQQVTDKKHTVKIKVVIYCCGCAFCFSISRKRFWDWSDEDENLQFPKSDITLTERGADNSNTNFMMTRRSHDYLLYYERLSWFASHRSCTVSSYMLWTHIFKSKICVYTRTAEKGFCLPLHRIGFPASTENFSPSIVATKIQKRLLAALLVQKICRSLRLF